MVVNAWVSGDSTYLAEVLSHTGYDAVTIDLQHGMFDVGDAIGLLQAASTGPAVGIARCPSLDPPLIGKLLDGGAWGIICPAIESAEACRAFVAACRYPPAGQRSYGPARGLLVAGPDYPALADRSVLTWAMVESAQGLAHLDDILGVEGLDGVYVGPNDLAMSLGEVVAPRPTDRVRQALVDIAAACRRAGRFSGVFASDPDTAGWLAEVGYDMVTPGNDAGLLRDAASRRIAVVRGGGDRRST